MSDERHSWNLRDKKIEKNRKERGPTAKKTSPPIKLSMLLPSLFSLEVASDAEKCPDHHSSASKEATLPSRPEVFFVFEVTGSEQDIVNALIGFLYKNRFPYIQGETTQVV
jgi:hypothetical protein